MIVPPNIKITIGNKTYRGGDYIPEDVARAKGLLTEQTTETTPSEGAE
jgi:hypothetical protein